MFQSHKELSKRTGNSGTPRFQYLKQLVGEYQSLLTDLSKNCASSTTSKPQPQRSLSDARLKNLHLREQVIANLANFAYDPINYEWFRQLNIVELFLDTLTPSTGDETEGYTNSKLVEFAMGGLCNCCLDPQNALIIMSNGISDIVSCLSSTNVNTVTSAITTLIYLYSPDRAKEVASKAIVDCMKRYSKSANARISNLANVYLETVVGVGVLSRGP